MSHIFRLYKEGSNTIADWDKAAKYGSTVIEQIEDPNGESSNREITSIPSPFARIDLVKTAFAKVVEMSKKTKTLDGDTIHHKLVSDCFDVGQLFFEFDKHKDKLEIIVWDKEKDLEALLKSDNPAHQQLGETYRIFLKQDGDTYNFNLLDRMYLLNFTKDESDTAEINIIGATSPATLFFTSANDLDYVTRNIQFGNDHPFDKCLCPLYKRNLEYLKFLWALKASIVNFSRLFKEVDAYLTESFKLMDDKTKKILKESNKEDLDQFSDIPVGSNTGHPVEILQGIKLKQHIADPGIIEKDSGFVIDSEHKINEHKPLVLPVDTYTHSTIYTKKDKWNKNTKVPYCVCNDDKNSILPKDRILPGEGSQYPYLTISDFLTDTIVRMPYEINKDSFFDGNIDRADGKSYLLPLTDLFFQFFTAEQLRGNAKDGKKMFELKNNAGGITAVLRVPIKDGKYIEYRRTYFEAVEPDIEKNDGGLIDVEHIDCVLFPNIQFKENNQAIYRFGLVSNFNESNNFFAEYKKAGGNEIDSKKKRLSVRNETRSSNVQCKNYSLEGSNFDYIKLTCKDIENVIIPILVEQQADDQEFTFAIDFGTTNTHIEYRIGNSKKINVFDILETDKQIHWFHGNSEFMTNAFDAEYIPVKTDAEFKFPTRTALSHGDNTHWGNAEAFEKAGLAALYEKRLDYKYNKIITNLKWSDNTDICNQVSCYIDSLFFMLRNKVILNSGNLSQTKIKWFYPVSMEKKRYENLEKNWEKAYKKYFGGELTNMTSITESVAPYEYYKGDGNAINIVTIDIGGGTTDIVIATDDNIDCISSFRFAANSIFGDAYAQNNRVKNGIIRQFKDIIRDELKQEINENDDIFLLFDQMYDSKSSDDVASFLFSLKSNKKVCGKGEKFSDNVDFSNKLQNDNTQKITFIFFYVAIIYHLANIMKAKSLKMPEKIVFSGNGSRVIQLLTTDEGVLGRFTKLIFERVYGASYHTDDLILILNKINPKEATCKGGFFVEKPDTLSGILQKKKVLHSKDNASMVQDVDTYATIDDKYINQTVKETEKFIQFVFDLLPFFAKEGYKLNATSIEIAKQICFKGLEIYTKNGLARKMKEAAKDEIIEETLFFYPLVGMLNALSDAICNKNLSNTK